MMLSLGDLQLSFISGSVLFLTCKGLYFVALGDVLASVIPKKVFSVRLIYLFFMGGMPFSF